MSAQVKYAYLKDQTWLYRRNYPKEVAAVLGRQALKQSLKTSDIKTARVRAAELNTQYEETVSNVLEGATSGTRVDDLSSAWLTPSDLARLRLRATLAHSGAPSFQGTASSATWTVKEASQRYLKRRQRELRPSGFKSVRYSVELFASAHPEVPLTDLTRDHGRQFLLDIAELSPLLGKGEATRQFNLKQSLAWSRLRTGSITARTQRRIWSQVTHWLDWCVYEDQLEVNPFKVVRFEQKVRYRPYEVPTDDEVAKLITQDDPEIGKVLMVCLLSGMRSGEATGLMRDDIVDRGTSGRFFHVQPNELRLLKTEAAERLVPVHSALEPVLASLPKSGPLFPDLSVKDVTKRFAHLRTALDLERPGLVFHSTRKWFITQCERTGVPEHWTASLVGHKSARSENGITYSIYSAGISDEQKREIVESIRLPVS